MSRTRSRDSSDGTYEIKKRDRDRRSEKAGKATIRELLNHGYQVMSVDTMAPAEHRCH
jgi:hypothetical protein